MLPRGRKFWPKKVEHQSGFEDLIATDLKERGISYGYETVQLTFTKLVCPHCKEIVSSGTYTPDFTIERPSGIRLIVEAKGRFVASDRGKHLRIKKGNPGADIRFLFQRDDKLGKSNPRRYSDWCIKNNYPFAVGNSIPQEWIDEPGRREIPKKVKPAKIHKEKKEKVPRKKKSQQLELI